MPACCVHSGPTKMKYTLGLFRPEELPAIGPDIVTPLNENTSGPLPAGGCPPPDVGNPLLKSTSADARPATSVENRPKNSETSDRLCMEGPSATTGPAERRRG